MSGNRQQEQLKDELANFASKYGPKIILPALVKEVNADDTIKIELSDDTLIDDCRLKSIVADGNKVLFVPVEGSVVLVARIENSDEFVVLAVHEISEVKVVIGDKMYSMNASGFLLQSGTDTLKQILTLIVEAVQQIVVLQGNNPNYTKLNQALAKINNLLQ